MAGRPTASARRSCGGPTLGGFQIQSYRGGNVPTFRVPPGTYSLMGYIFTMDEPNLFALASAVVGRPQLVVTGDMTVTLDARQAKRIVTDTQRPTAPADIQLGYFRTLDGFSFSSSFTMGPPIDEAYAAPTEQVTPGEFEFYSKWSLLAPTIQMSVTRPQQIPLDPLFAINSPTVDGTHTLPLVFAGFGRPEDYVGRDVRGKIALVSRGAGVTFVDKIRNAANAGAASVIIFNNVPGLLFIFGGDPGTVPIPAFTIDQNAGLMLVNLLEQGPVRVQYSGTSVSPYLYDAHLPNPGRIADSQTYKIDASTTARVETDYHGNADPVVGTDIRHAFRPLTTFSFGVARNLPHPLERTEWVSADPNTRWWHLVWANFPFDGEFDGTITTYQPRTLHSEGWFSQVARPGMPPGLTGWEDSGAPAYREGDQFRLQIFPYVDGDRHLGWGFSGDVADTKLFRDGQLLADGTYPIGTFPAVPGSATYRLVFDEKRSTPWWKHSTDVNTTWTFTSATPPSGRQLLPLLQIDYDDLTLDLLNQAPDRSAYTFRLGAGHQPGVSGLAITSVQLWASFNDGGTWRPVDLADLGNGRVQATLQHPRVANTSDAVSLRVRATDAAGNSIDQTVIRAYGLRSTG